MSINRRNFVKASGLAAAASSTPTILNAQTAKKRVIVVGGGFGGATAARYVKKFDPEIKVTLVEVNKSYVTCPGSNWVIGGLREMRLITHSYDKLASDNDITVVQDWVSHIDTGSRGVKLSSGEFIKYDRLIVSPGIDFRFDAIEGYDEKVSRTIPHAWKAGAQTIKLRNQLVEMRDGGLFIIAAPQNPFRCPPGPYERASMAAHFLSEFKPRSKILILDAKTKFSKQGLFFEGWRELYGFESDNSMIEWIGGAEGEVKAVDAKNNVVIAGELEEEHQGDVLNIIPPQMAGRIAQAARLADDSGWCPVDPETWESKRVRGIHVIGDAAIAAPLPKSAYAANSEAKVCAAAVVDLLNERKPRTPSWVNTCYSLIAPNYGISVAMVYELTAEGVVGKVEGAGGVTPEDGNHKLEAVFANSWYNNIVTDIFG
ncbi:MAG: FCSD flavin-binding domain-containing protein [Gammaproteobacteria bacterium]